MKEVLKFLNSLDLKEKYVVLGCSYGPDSMMLLHVLKTLKIKVICAHVNHNIRKESIDEYNKLQKYTKDNNIIMETLSLEKGNHNESYYRKKRYDFYKKIADKYNTKYIMTAHHGDDLIETILMRITRGSNLKGYLGFNKIFNEKQYVFLKPLVYITKDEILEYNKKNNIPYAIDASNIDNKYTRNRYRNNVLPFMKKEDKKVHLKYMAFSNELNDAYECIKKISLDYINNNFKDNILCLDGFQKLDPYIKKTIINIILSNIYGDNIDKINKKHINNLIEVLEKGKNFSMDFPYNKKIIREYNYLKFNIAINNNTYNIKLEDETILPNGDSIYKVNSTKDNSNYIIRLNKKDIKLPLYIRSKKTSDKIAVKNLGGTKSIKKILIDEKIPASKRNDILLVVDSNDEVLWIPGIKKSKFDINKDEKCDIILKYERKERKNAKEKK